MSESEHVQDRLDDYLDGYLGPDEADGVRRHLAGCADCAAEAAAIGELRASARALPREIAPPRDLWGGIAARIEARPAGAEVPPPVIAIESRRRATVTRWRGAGMAAAALVLITLSSGITAYLMRPSPVASLPTLPAAQVGSGAALAGFRPAEAELLATVAALERELAARRGQLGPATAAVVEHNLRIIDRAIAEARAALLADPANTDLPHHLSDVYRQKVQLLQRAVHLPVART